MKEEFVTLETAKLLKEKGFDERTLYAYQNNGIFKGPNDGGQWDTYEEALEAGIQKAIELI